MTKKKLLTIGSLTLLLLTIITGTIYALEGLTDISNFDPGKALNDLKENNAVVGILYSLVFIEAVIIVFLWKRLDKVNDKLLKNYEDRLEREENTNFQINKLNAEMEVVKDSKKTTKR
jgi:hypothetical protein